MSSGTQATTSQVPKYQGYPYVNPPAFGVPSIDSQTAARWANLPRRPIGAAVRVQEQAGSSGPESAQSNEKPEENMSYKSDDEPVLYIDLPEQGESDIYERSVDTPQSSRGPDQAQSNKDYEPPVVYIEIPECSGSGVSERRPDVEDGPSNNVVQETIFYDQFKDRKIDVRPADYRDSENDSSSSNNSTMRVPFGSNPRRQVGYMRPQPSAVRRPSDITAYEDRINRRPQPPTTLNLRSPGSSTGYPESSSSTRPTPTYLPSYLTPQEYQDIYRASPDDEFRFSPLPVTDFPEPPPAYSEIDLRSPPPSLGSTAPIIGNNVSNMATPDHNMGNRGQLSVITQQPQRTTVIVNECGRDRKILTCQSCRMIIQSIVIREITLGTHLAAAFLFMLGCIPCSILVYCSKTCKGKVHYCPNCNQKISKSC